MSATGLEVFDTTVQKNNTWLKDLMEVTDGDRPKACQALRAVLHALHDRLTVEEAAEFAAQLPMLIRGIYYEGRDPTGKPVKERKREQFLARIRRHIKSDGDANAEVLARAVFSLLAKHITGGRDRQNNTNISTSKMQPLICME
jgi:uncharacterized protein (DUF2267 family)